MSNTSFWSQVDTPILRPDSTLPETTEKNPTEVVINDILRPVLPRGKTESKDEFHSLNQSMEIIRKVKRF